MVVRRVSKHALSRMIERNILSQNIKPNKKQIKKNTKKAIKHMNIDLNSFFAQSYSSGKKYLYVYCDLDHNGLCKKYVLDGESRDVITLIKNIVFSEEIEKYNLYLNGNGHDVKHCSTTDYIYKRISNKDFLFVVNPLNKLIHSYNYVRDFE